MVILFSLAVLEDISGVACVFGGDLEQVVQPRRGIVTMVDVEILVGDHVGDQEGLDLADGSVIAPLGGEVAGAVGVVLAVVGKPFFDGFFAIVEDQPDGVALGRMSAEDIADLDEEGSSRGSVVGSVELDVAQRVIGLVVSDEDDDAVFFTGIFDDVVAHRLESSRSGGSKGVSFEVSFGGFGGEVLLDELFGLLMAGRAVEALGGDLEKLRREIVGGLPAEAGGGLLGRGTGGGQ